MLRYLCLVLMISGLLMGNAHATDLITGLVAHWSFDDCSANDVSGKGNDGTIYGSPQCVDGVIGKALKLNGTAKINTQPFAWNVNQVSMAGWIKPDSVYGTGGWNSFITKGENATMSSPENVFALEFSYTQGAHFRIVGANSNDGIYCNSILLTAGQWDFISVVYDGNSVKFYKNGQLKCSNSLSVTLSSTSSPIVIGRDRPGSDEYLSGQIDDIYIYNRALSDTEVAALANTVSVTPPSFDFGTLTSGDEPRSAIISLQNNGLTAITPDTASVVTADPSSLSIIWDTCSQQSVAPGASCYIYVQFAPVAYKDYTGTLLITANGYGYSVPLQGKSVVTGAVYNQYSLVTTKGGVPNTSLLGSVNGDNDYLSGYENNDLNKNPVTHALYPVEFYTQKTDCSISQNGTPEPENDNRQPLILIHGWQGGHGLDYPSILCENAQLGETYWDNFIPYFNASPTLRSKYRLYVYHYPSYKHVTFNARVLSRMLQRNAYIKGWIANGGKISIIAHSMGGLVSRSLIEEHLSAEDAAHSFQYIQGDGSTVNKSGVDILDRLITTATPHHGSPGATYWWLFSSPNWAAHLAWLAKDLFTPGSQDLFWDNYDGVLAKVFENNKTLSIGYYPSGANFSNSARMATNTNFDNCYRNKLNFW